MMNNNNKLIIDRDYYLNKLVSRMHNGQVKVITGIRRCGKSFLMNELFYNYLIDTKKVNKDHIIRFAFDSIQDISLLGEEALSDFIKSSYQSSPSKLISPSYKVDPYKFINYIDSKMVKDNTSQSCEDEMYYLLLDEVQLLGAFEFVLISYLRERNVDVYVTGSNAKFLSKDVITEFAGRGCEVHLQPLSFSEYYSFNNNNRKDNKVSSSLLSDLDSSSSLQYKDRYQLLNEYMLYGGIPSVVLKEDDESKVKELNNLFTEIYLKDIKLRYKVRDEGVLVDLLNVLSSSIGSLSNPDRIMNTLKSEKKSKITSQTIKRYIEYFKDSFLIDEVQRYDIRGRKYINSPLKYYFCDLGLRNCRLNFRQFEMTHAFENVIYNELKSRGYQVDVGLINLVERNEESKLERKQIEVDFVCNLGFKKYYIQSAFSLKDESKYSQEVRPFRKIDDSFKKILITYDGSIPSHYNEDGILILNVFDFLLDKKSLDM